MRAVIGGRTIVLGNTSLLRDTGGDAAPLAADAERLRAEGASVIYLAVDGRLAGLLAVHDPIKESTPGAIKALHDRYSHRHGDRLWPNNCEGGCGSTWDR